METEVIKILIGSLGGGGVTVWAAFIMFKSYKGAIAQKDTVYENRLERLEESSAECSRDREQLHEKLHELEVGVIRESTMIIRENTAALNKVLEFDKERERERDKDNH